MTLDEAKNLLKQHNLTVLKSPLFGDAEYTWIKSTEDDSLPLIIAEGYCGGKDKYVIIYTTKASENYKFTEADAVLLMKYYRNQTIQLNQ